MNTSESYPEWPKGLGDPRVTVHSDVSVATSRREVITKFRVRGTLSAECKPPIPKKRPHLRQFQAVQFAPCRCSFQLHCHGDVATKQCHSCIKFDKTRLGYYCDACFATRHPDYRLPHSWTQVSDATNQDEEWVSHITRHNLEQDAAEIKLLLSSTQALLVQSSSLSDKSGQKISAQQTLQLPSKSIDFKKTYATAATLHRTLQDLLNKVHEQLEQKPPLSTEEALIKIQTMWKIRQARKQLKALVREVYASFEDPTTGQTYYYNKYTKETQWTKPIMLGQDSLMQEKKTPQKASKAPTIFISREEQEQYAVLKLQSMARSHSARRHMRKLISSVYEKIWDDNTKRFYYHNTRTKEVKWEKPRWVNDDDLLTPRTRYAQLQREAIENAENKLSAIAEEKAKKPRESLTPDEAAGKLQSMVRSHFARRHMRRLISSVYEKIWDADARLFYYHNTNTKEVKWEKPRWVSDEDILTPRTRFAQLQQEARSRGGQAQVAIKARKTVDDAHKGPATQDEAARMVQRAYRRKKGFQNLLRLCRSVYERIYDPEQGLYYYHNTRTKETTWDKPLLLRGAESDVFTPRTRQKKLQLLTATTHGRTIKTPRQWTEESAATRLQGLYRQKKAKTELGAKLMQRFKQAIDPSSGLVYYVNVQTQEVSWDPPALLLRSGVQIETLE